MTSISLPDELVFNILHFLDPCEVIRLRLVSKQFNDVTRDSRLWRHFYAISRLLRPPGPFMWQSMQFLQNVLIHSARVSRTWTSQPFNVVSRVQGPRVYAAPSPTSSPCDFLLGRLFIWCEHEQLLVQDVETGIGQVLWEGAQPISSLKACSMTFPDAERVFVSIRHVDAPVAQRTPIKLLGFPLLQNDDRLTLGSVIFDMDLPTYAALPLFASTPFIHFHGGIDRFLGPYESVVVNVRTCTAYRFPVFNSSIGGAIPDELPPWWPGFTLTAGDYVLIVCPWNNSPSTLIQAYIAPDPVNGSTGTDVGQLRLTHEVLVKNISMPSHCLRGAIVNRTTGDTSVRLLCSRMHLGRMHFVCIDIIIPPMDLASTKSLPMTLETHEFLVLPGNARVAFMDASDDGYGRGIVTVVRSVELEESVLSHFLSHYKFSVDASGDLCTAAVSEPSERDKDLFYLTQTCVFDGVRGRMCRSMRRADNSYDLVVLNLR